MQKKKKDGLVIALDCDDVLYDCNEAAVVKLNQTHGTFYSKQNITTWGCTGSLLDERIRYFENPEFVANQDLLPGAKAFVQELLNMDGVKDIVLVTAVLPQCATARYESILKLLPEINPDNIIITCNKSCIKTDVMLDDGVHNLDAAVHVKHRYLFNQPWNAAISEYQRIHGYDEFIEKIQKLTEMQ